MSGIDMEEEERFMPPLHVVGDTLSDMQLILARMSDEAFKLHTNMKHMLAYMETCRRALAEHAKDMRDSDIDSPDANALRPH